MGNESTNTEPVKDEMLAKLESMLKTMPEGGRQPILDLINKRKVELGLMNSGLPNAGYKLRKTGAKPKTISKESRDSLRKIATKVGKVKETEDVVPHDIDIKNEVLKKDKKVLEEADSYKY